MTPLYSILLPVHNSGKWLNKCIDSIRKQTFSDYEVIIVDDGSTDGSSEICDRYAEEDDRVHVIHQENAGLPTSRAVCVQNAKGEYVWPMDSDDWIHPEALSTISEHAKKAGYPDVICFGYKVVRNNYESENVPQLPEGKYEKPDVDAKIRPFIIYDPNQPFLNPIISCHIWEKVYKREYMLKHYCKDFTISRNEDWSVMPELLLSAESIYVMHNILYYYNKMNTGSNTATKKKIKNDYQRKVLDYMKHHNPKDVEYLKPQFASWVCAQILIATKVETTRNKDERRPLMEFRREMKDEGLFSLSKGSNAPAYIKFIIFTMKHGIIRPWMFLAKHYSRKYK